MTVDTHHRLIFVSHGGNGRVYLAFPDMLLVDQIQLGRHRAVAGVYFRPLASTTMTMSIAETIPWVYPSLCSYPSFKLGLQYEYPDLPTQTERRQAWATANEASIREAMTVYLAVKAEDFLPGITIDPPGSPFCACSPQQFHIPIYWNPSMISYEHEDFEYIVTSPEKVAALHALRDRGAAIAYLLEDGHHDERKPVHPMRATIPDGWDEAAIAAAGTPVPPKAWFEGKMRTRYTLTDWRKCKVARATMQMGGIPMMLKYYEGHYDLKEVMDTENNVVSCERGEAYADGVWQSSVVPTLARF